jgi:hypothetical protein
VRRLDAACVIWWSGNEAGLKRKREEQCSGSC